MGNRLRDSTALAVRGLPCLHRFVLVAIATITPDDKGTFYASLREVARITGTQVVNVRRIVRRYEGRPNMVEGEGHQLTGRDPGCFLYPVGDPAKSGQADRCHYTFAIPEVGPARPRRAPKNPTGRTDYARSTGRRGRFHKPPTTPPQGEVCQTSANFAAAGEGEVSQTGTGGSRYLPSGGLGNRQIKEELNDLRGGAGAPPLPPQEGGRPGDTPGQQTPPGTPRPTLADPILEAARRTLAKAQSQEAEEGEGKSKTA